jgi:cytochrome c oxidase assembly protein subunit 15
VERRTLRNALFAFAPGNLAPTCPAVIGRNENAALRWFAVFTAFATLCLICIGGLVTSHEAGMAVPDWPTSYGYNMFFFPIAHWWHAGNIFYEHSHRLFASGVGLLTTILAIWIWRKDDRRWLRWLGVAAFFGVVLQGILGGLRVTAMKDEIGIFHATLAQLFFALVSAIALFHTKFWRNLENPAARITNHGSNLRFLFAGTTLLILCQLVLGATMRHQHAGLAIPDFPKAYGKWWPDMGPEAVAGYNHLRTDTTSYKEITTTQIALQMTHRIVAGLIFLAVTVCAWLTNREFGWQTPLSRISLAWLVLIVGQIFLGAATIWKGKAADIATTHVAVGALSLVTGTMLSIISFRVLQSASNKCEAVRESAYAQPVASKS